MTTLKEFEEALEAHGLRSALDVLENLRKRDRSKRTLSPARRVAGQKMTVELAHRILELHRTTSMTQQEIAFQLGVNQGRVNEVVKHGKWLVDNPNSPEAKSRDAALERERKRANGGRSPQPARKPRPRPTSQLGFADF